MTNSNEDHGGFKKFAWKVFVIVVVGMLEVVVDVLRERMEEKGKIK